MAEVAGHASAEEREIDEINSGIMAAPKALLVELMGQISNDNAQGEYYLTDAVVTIPGSSRSA